MVSGKSRNKIILSFVLTFTTGTLLVTGYLKYSDKVNDVTKKLTYSVAKMELNPGQNSVKDEREQGGLSSDSSVTIPSMLSVGKERNEFDESVTLSTQPLWSIDMAPEEVETPVDKGETTQPSLNSSDIEGKKPYPENLETKSGVIKEVTFGKCTSSQYINLATAGQVRNCTKVSNDDLAKESRLLPEFRIKSGNNEPQVLIMHTHTTESFEPYRRNFFDASFNSRTTDMSMNVCAVGDEIAKKLENAGIGVIHDTTVHDYPQYTGSYQRSCVTVQKILKKYPSIKVVLDVHRDAISPSKTERTAPVTTINGKKAAQVMIISGCDDGTMNMPNYMKNFRFASLLQQKMESSYPTLTRPVLFDYRNYNQQLTTGSLLLEIGSHANSIEEVKYSGQLVGESLVKALSELK